jgi:hypothetical protein
MNKNKINDPPYSRELILSESNYMTPPDGEMPEILIYFPDSINKTITAIQQGAMSVKKLSSSTFLLQPTGSFIK